MPRAWDARWVLGLLSMLAGGCGGERLTELPSVGSVRVFTATTGADVGKQSYALLVDGTVIGRIPANSEVAIDGLSPGDHEIRLGDIPIDCGVAIERRTEFVIAGKEVKSPFWVTCAPDFQGVLVKTVTTGTQLDPDGYTVTVMADHDWNNVPFVTSRAVGVNEAGMPIPVPRNDHLAELSGVAGNCTVAPPTMQYVFIKLDQLTPVEFTITCTAVAGGP
jgi:hypothetical protein